ncbi:MAG: hypothetical protein ABJC04_02855 [Verrucomicrobiota bacterium]
MKPQIAAMRVLIQSTITHLYLLGRDKATQSPDQAFDFKNTTRALHFIKQNRLNHVQLVLKFPQVSNDVNVAILELLEKEHFKKISRKETGIYPKQISSP